MTRKNTPKECVRLMRTISEGLGLGLVYKSGRSERDARLAGDNLLGDCI